MGTTFTAYYSVDGSTWVQVDTQTMSFGTPFYVGLIGATNETDPTTDIQIDSLSVGEE